MNFVPQAIQDYALLHSSPEDPLLSELSALTQKKAQYPQMMSGHVECSLLRLLIQTTGARKVLELGTLTGYSALSMAMGLPEDGRIITCDVDPEMTAIAQSFWARTPHSKKIDLRMGPALDTIKTLDGPFDLVFIDADKPNYINYWDAVLPKVRVGGLVAVDNVLWYGKVVDPKEPSDHAMIAFNKHVHNDPRVELVMLTVRDGITLARKK